MKKGHNENSLVVTGKRKTSVAKASIREGKGQIKINGQNYLSLPHFHKISIAEPIEIYKKIFNDLKFDILVKVRGGGKESQIQAARLSIARSLVKKTDSQELRKAFLNYDKNMLIADVRRKEPNKPGDSKARASRQASKR